jgi:hypothetical protein
MNSELKSEERMKPKQSFRVFRRAAVLIVLAVLVCAIHIKANIYPLVFLGDAIPGTANFRFATVRPAVVNTSGTIAFGAEFVDPATKLTGFGIFKIVGGHLIPVVMEGQAVPDVPGASFGGATSDPSMNAGGDIVFLTDTNEGPNQSAASAIYEESAGVLRRVLDYKTLVPGTGGETFSSIGVPQINDSGAIAFMGSSSTVHGVFLLSNATLQLAIPQSVDRFSLNNRGDIAFSNSSGAFLLTGGSVQSIPLPSTVPGTSLSMTSINGSVVSDNDDVAFLSSYGVPTGRGSCCQLIGDAVLRWRSGSLGKIVAAGDPVPGVSGATFGENFLTTEINPTATLFWDGIARSPTSKSFGVIGRYQNGSLTTVVTDKDYVDGVGTLDFVASPKFDTREGPLMTFVANAASGSMIGLFAVTSASQYTLRFPHIADGGGAGGWHTTFELANRSAWPATATISFYDDSGAPLNLAVGGQQQSQTTVTVPALGVTQVQTQGGGPLLTGWALAQSDQNLSGIALFGLLDGSGNATTEVGAPASLPLLSMSLFAQTGANTSTGVALANPNATAADVTLILKASDSTEITRTTLTIAPMGHIARYAAELFSTVPPGEFQGKIEILSTQPLAALTLRQRGSVFTSLPVVP